MEECIVTTSNKYLEKIAGALSIGKRIAVGAGAGAVLGGVLVDSDHKGKAIAKGALVGGALGSLSKVKIGKSTNVAGKFSSKNGASGVFTASNS